MQTPISIFANDVCVWSADPNVPAQRTDIRPASLSRTWEGPAELMLRVDGWNPDALAIDTVVAVNNASSLAALFVGISGPPKLSRDDGNQAYTSVRCLDHGAIWRPATTATGQSSFSIGAKPLGEAVAELYAHVAAALTAPLASGGMGFHATPMFSGGAESLPCLPIQFDNMGIFEAMQAVARAAPGAEVQVSIYPDTDHPAFHFVNLNGLPVYDLVIEQSIVGQIEIELSLEGRAGAVKTNARQVSGYSPIQFSTACAPAWNPADEANWNLDAVGTTNEAGDPSALGDVFRKFSYAASGMFVPVNAKFIAQVLQGERWVNMELDEDRTDTANRTVVLIDPAIPRAESNTPTRSVNPRATGRATAAPVRIGVRGSTSGFVTVPGTRYPASGFSGPAYDLSPVMCGVERVIEVPAGTDHAAYAQAAHAVYSRPIVRGTLKVKHNAMRDAWWHLLQRVNVTSNTHGPTGLETMAAPLRGVSIEFGDTHAEASIDFSDQRRVAGEGDGA